MRFPANQSDQKPPVEKLALNVDEVSELLGISPRLVFKLTKEKKLPHKKLGKRLVYPLAAIRRYLDDPDTD